MAALIESPKLMAPAPVIEDPTVREVYADNFAGVVFNRAQARDFERSISGMSLRSIARANGHGPNRGNGHPSPFNTAAADTAATKAFGPVARAVASSVQAEEDDRA